MLTKTSAIIFISFLLLLLFAWVTNNWTLLSCFLLALVPFYYVYATLDKSNKYGSSQRDQRQRTELQTEGYDDIDGREGYDEIDSGESQTSRKPGYIYVQEKIAFDGTSTHNYKVEVNEQEPPEVVDCGSFSLKLVPDSRFNVKCIVKTKEDVTKVLRDYSNANEGEGWYKVDTNEDFNGFIATFKKIAKIFSYK